MSLFSFMAVPKQADAFLGIGDWVIDPITELETTYTAVIDSGTAASTYGLMLKEYVGDPIGWFVAKVLLQKMTQSTVSWINNGFNGAPAFVSDPNTYFSTLSDQVAGQFLLQNPDLNFLCSPFGTQLRITLNNQRQQPYGVNGGNFRCALSSVVGNIDAFTSNFANGSWAAWGVMTQDDLSNPYGAYLSLTDELQRQEDNQVGAKSQQLSWGKGFLTYQTCTDTGVKTQSGNAVKNCHTDTPGSVIEAQLEKSLGSGAASLNAADEIDEIVGALMTQLVSKSLSSISGGLRGLGNAQGLDDGGADIQSHQNIQVPSQPTCTAGSPGILNPDGTVTGAVGTSCSTPNPNDYINNYGEGYIDTTNLVPTPPPQGPVLVPAQVPATQPADGGTNPTVPPTPPATPPTTPSTTPPTASTCPNFNCTFASLLKSPAATACTMTGSGEVFSNCAAGDPNACETNPTNGSLGTWVAMTAAPQMQCGACQMVTASCDVNGFMRNCTATFQQTTAPSCAG